MEVLNVIIKAKAPLLVSERRPDGQFRPSSSHIPGAVWRGALAQQFISADETASDDFKDLFTADDAPLFRHAFPARLVKVGDSEKIEAARPLPATAFSCKAESGFESQDKHGVFDSLIDRLCGEELGVIVPYQPRCNHQDHRQGQSGENEGGRVEAYSGFHQNGQSVFVPMRLTTRVAINRRRKVAEPNLLYSPLVISEAAADGAPTVFCASITVNENNRALVKERLPQLTHIGSGAARGFGQVKVTTDDMPADDLKDRLSRFNECLQRRWRLWERMSHNRTPLHTPDHGAFFAVLLLADAVLRDGWTPTVRLEPMLFSEALREAVLLRCYATAEYRGGWNTAWGLPKDTELAARMSSVYVYHTPRQADDESLLNALRELELQGVGERCNEGFGQVRVCDEFHLQIQK